MRESGINRVRALSDEYGFTFDAVSGPTPDERGCVHDIYRALIDNQMKLGKPYQGFRISVMVTKEEPDDEPGQ